MLQILSSANLILSSKLSGIWSGYRLNDLGFESRQGLGMFFHHRVQIGSGAHQAPYPMGTRGSFPGGKWSGREADHSTPSSAEVKEYVELYLHSPVRLHGVVLS
jgi:hypothetical protein